MSSGLEITFLFYFSLIGFIIITVYTNTISNYRLLEKSVLERKYVPFKKIKKSYMSNYFVIGFVLLLCSITQGILICSITSLVVPTVWIYKRPKWTKEMYLEITEKYGIESKI